jgi:twitching motility protein PilT
VLRHIPSPIPELAALRIPPVAKRIALEDRGLVLVTGATGNGKSTTIAAMLDYMNRKVPKHVVTIEDPVEFVFDDDQCTFSQREVGRDVTDLGEGLHSAMREDPDVIFVGEIRAPEEFDVALTAAEAGHLVVSTFHSADSSSALMRMINLYPQDYRDAARQRVADAVTGIISQRLVPQRGTNQRVLIAEILRPTPTVQDCIRDPNRFRGIPAALEASTHEYGTQSFDQQLLAMVRDGLVSVDTARAAARSPKDLVRNLKLTR